MKPQQVKKLLFTQIRRVAANPEKYTNRPGVDFSRNRKLPLERLITGIIGMDGGSLSRELLKMFHYSPNSASVSAFVQQREKLKPKALEEIFRSFSAELSFIPNEPVHLLAVDGTDVQIFADPKDPDSYYSGANGQKPYSLLHVNALYDLRQQIYLDAIVQKGKQRNEHTALCSMVDRSDIAKAIVIADRGYESYNDMAHIQEKGWYFLIRVKDGRTGIKSSLILPDTESFDVSVSLQLTRKQTNEMKGMFQDKNHYRFIPASSTFDYLPVHNQCHNPAAFYTLDFRIVRFPIAEGSYETVLTNLPQGRYPVQRLKEMYSCRWGIETSFRDLKYTVGLMRLHSKKVMNILQEIFANLIMYNFAETITSHVFVQKKQRKYTYKANFSVSACVCKVFFQGDISPPELEAVVARNLIPIRPDRHRERAPSAKTFQGFLYRIA